MNRPVHFEIHAADPAKLSKFYADVFGWRITHMPQFDYYLINTGDADGPGINGGFVKRMGAGAAAGAPVNAFVCSLGVNSLDEAIAKATAAGAQIALPKMAIPGVGWQAYIRDPDENIVGLHQADQNAK
ncbi:MAG TPA: VOC family protein, partial [Rhizomicrobium sp.]|jgi:predicted enzyme related to lactoylglutathione lyase|nr:VOC family protein [Rhizomicrobium sp.]